MSARQKQPLAVAALVLAVILQQALRDFLVVRIIAEARRLLANPRANAPVLIAQGRPDPVTSVEASIEFYQRLVAPVKELKIYDGFLHELHNEKGRAGVLEDYLAWIEKTTMLLTRQNAGQQASTR